MIGPRTRAVTNGFDWRKELPWVNGRMEGRIDEWREGKVNEEVVCVLRMVWRMHFTPPTTYRNELELVLSSLFFLWLVGCVIVIASLRSLISVVRRY